MINKYDLNIYYPLPIEELCVGSEFELFYKNKWEKHKIYNYEDLYSLALNFYNTQFRIKYLDKDDLINKGWKYLEKYDNYVKGNYEEFSLKMDKKSYTVIISYYGEPIYIGECKSINELRKLEKWLNIAQ